MAFTVKFILTGGIHTVSGKFFLTDSGGSVVNGTVRITVVDDSSFLDIVNPTSSTVSQISAAGGITELDVTTSGGNFPTINDLTIDTAAPVEVDPTNATITITGQVPEILTNTRITPANASITITGQQPVVHDNLPTPPAANITITGQTPQVLTNNRITPGNASITITGQTPNVVVNTLVLPQHALIRIFGQVPEIIGIVNVYIQTQTQNWLGRYRRSQKIPITMTFQNLPDASPTLRIFNGATLLTSVRLPVLEKKSNTFEYDLFLDETFVDGNYVIETLWQENALKQYQIDYFQVKSGIGRPAILGIVEQQRPLGQAAISIDADGRGRMGYNARLPT